MMIHLHSNTKKYPKVKLMIEEMQSGVSFLNIYRNVLNSEYFCNMVMKPTTFTDILTEVFVLGTEYNVSGC